MHITAVQVPSDTTTPEIANHGGDPIAMDGGVWHEPWTERVQAEWLRQFLEVTLSKPFVETVSWHSLADHAGQLVPHGGLLRADLEPKEAYKQMVDTRALLMGLKSSRGLSG